MKTYILTQQQKDFLYMIYMDSWFFNLLEDHEKRTVRSTISKDGSYIKDESYKEVQRLVFNDVVDKYKKYLSNGKTFI